MARILLIPSDHGGGMGHVSRCTYLAELFRKQGHGAAVVLEQKHFKQFAKNDGNFFLLKTAAERFVKYQMKRPRKPSVRLKSRVLKRPVFVEFSGLAYQVPRDAYVSTKIVRYRLHNLLKSIDTYKPDLLVGDGHFLSWLAGRSRSLPVSQITRLAGFPPQPDFLWWDGKAADLKQPDALAPFVPLLEHMKLDAEVAKIEDLLQGDRYIIPAISEVEPVAQKDNVIFSGPLADTANGTNADYFPEDLHYPKIYVTIGGGAGRSNEKRFFDALVQTFKDQEYQLVVSTGRRVAASSYRKKAHNILFEDWVSGRDAIRQSDLVIFHGGYGTMLEILDAARPAVVLPSHTEQQGNGKRLEQLAVGRQLDLAVQRDKMCFNWPYGDYEMGARFDFSFPGEELLQTVHDLIYGDTFDKAQKLSQKLKEARENFNVNALLDI